MNYEVVVNISLKSEKLQYRIVTLKLIIEGKDQLSFDQLFDKAQKLAKEKHKEEFDYIIYLKIFPQKEQL